MIIFVLFFILDHNRTVGNGPTTAGTATKQSLPNGTSSPKTRVSTPTSANGAGNHLQRNLPVISSPTTAQSPEPTTPTLQRNATIILETATVLNNNNNNNNISNHSTSNSRNKDSSNELSTTNNRKINGVTSKTINCQNNLKNLKNLSSKIVASSPTTQQLTSPSMSPPPPINAVDETVQKELKKQLGHANKGVEALSVLVQYLVYHVSI